jgi:hypothetical protein
MIYCLGSEPIKATAEAGQCLFYYLLLAIVGSPVHPGKELTDLSPTGNFFSKLPF